MESHSKAKISYTLQAINIIPILLLGMLVLLLGTHFFSRAIYNEVNSELLNESMTIIDLYDAAYPGDYSLKSDTSLKFYKGDYDLTTDYTLIDRLKEETGLDISIFYMDTVILSTINNNDNVRVIGLGAPTEVSNQVLTQGKNYFSEKIMTFDYSLTGIYTPLKNSDGTIIGILFVGKPTSLINKAIYTSILPLLIATLLALILILVFIKLYTTKLFSALSKLHVFFNQVEKGDLNASLDKTVSSRNDEFGDIGKSALSMQRAMRNMIETDPLTELSNRRSANRKLQAIINRDDKSLPFCVAIGDIDFFKKVNDTYGHDCGDVVLKAVAKTLRNFMREYGFVARWGGEEFLLVFDHTTLYEAHDLLVMLLEQICSLRIKYGDQVVRVSMTFGITDGHTSDTNVLFNEADALLYRGKQNGRHQVVSERDKIK